MTVITDVPQSGIYFQQGAIVRLIAQMLDTGLPVPLQTATGLVIAILYPDRVTTQSFAAELYTDGSDGMIAFTTRNDGRTIDLSQVGLYELQGMAVIGGVQLPPSYESDFYVLENVFGGSNMPIFTPSAVVLYDTNSVRWVGTVTPSGDIEWVAQPSGPSSFLQFNQLVMKDDNGVYWTMSISTLGVVTGTPGGTFANAIDFFTMADINNKSWIVKVDESGDLGAA